MFPFKEKEEKRHFCKLLIHKARSISWAASLERTWELAETFEVLILIDLKREEKILEEKTEGGPGLSQFGIFSYLKELKVRGWAWSTRWSLTVTWFILFRLSCCKYRASFTFYGIKCGKLTTDVSNQEWRGSCCYQASSLLSNTPDPTDKNKERCGRQGRDSLPYLDGPVWVPLALCLAVS